MGAIVGSPSIGQVTFGFCKDQPSKVIKWARTGLDWTKYANNGLTVEGQKARDVFNITYNMLSLPEVPGNVKNVGESVVDLTSASTPSEFTWTVGKLMADTCSLISNVADVAGIFDRHVKPIASNIMVPLNQASIVGLGLSSTYHIAKYAKDIFDLGDKDGCDPLTGDRIVANSEDINRIDIDRARSSQQELLIWKIAEKVTYVALAAVLCLTTFAAFGFPVWVILTLQTTSLVFGTVKYFYEEMVTAPANKNISF